MVRYEIGLFSESNKTFPDDSEIKHGFSKGWLKRFQNRYNLKFCRGHEEALSAGNHAIRLHNSRTYEFVNAFGPCNIWNVDSFNLYSRSHQVGTFQTVQYQACNTRNLG